MVGDTPLASAAAAKLPVSTTRTNIAMLASVSMIENPWFGMGRIMARLL